MRTLLSTLLTAVLVGVPAVPQSARDQGLLDDLRFVVAEVPARHPNFFLVTPETVFQAAAAALEATIPTISDEEFYVRLCSLVAMGQDSHTNLNSVQYSERIGFRLLPIEFRLFEEGVYVIAATADHRSLNQARLLRIGDTPIDDVLSLLRPVVAHENDYWFRFLAPGFLRSQGVLRGLGIAPATGPTPATFLLASGQEVTEDLSPAFGSLIRPVDERAGFTPATLRRTGEFYWHEYWPANRTLYVRYSRCREMPDRPFDGFIDNVLASMEQNAPESIVFDVRGNTGGDSKLFTRFYLRFLERVPALTANPRFRMFGLMDGGTFSSGAIVVWGLKAPLPGLTPATTIGEPTGGKPDHFGNVTGLQLPHSGLYLQHSKQWFTSPEWIPDADAVYPDTRVPVRATSYFARHDAEMAVALARATRSAAAPTGDIIVVNGASFRPETGIAAGSFVAGFGGFSAGGLEVLVNDVSASLLGAVDGQVVFRVPEETPAGEATVELRQAGAVVATGRFAVTEAGPGIFVMQPGDVTQPGAVLNQDYQLNSANAREARGRVIQVFATGHGPLDGSGRAEASAWIAQHPATVLYSGPAPGFPGLWQINVLVPVDLPVTGEVPLFIAAHGFVSNGVTIWVK